MKLLKLALLLAFGWAAWWWFRAKDAYSAGLAEYHRVLGR